MLIISLGVIASVYILLFYCILGIGLVSLCKVLTIIKKGEKLGLHKLRKEFLIINISNALWHKLRGSVLMVSLDVIASVYILLFYCILGIGLV